MTSKLVLISFMRSDDSQDIKSVEVARAILHAKLKACILSPLEGNSKGQKAKKKIHVVREKKSLSFFRFFINIMDTIFLCKLLDCKNRMLMLLIKND